ncbi:hypothetical protein [Brevundimonas sp. M20]|uniref:hypothetical protein n=1 Tax=Brevundimonas sp. M20 TaxID=2591463 RepID=UPI00143DEE5E|nr:hypothetical protein [Brevundimonas sp. M20]
MPSDLRSRRSGYLAVDALAGLAVMTLGVAAAVGLAATTVTRLAQAKDRLTAMRIADDLYEDLYAGVRPDGQQSGSTDGRPWTYESLDADGSAARRIRITVDRRFGQDLVVDAVAPPAPATPSSSS